VLELGCGTGTVLVALAQVATARGAPLERVVGVDGSEGMLRIAAQRAPALEWLLGDMRELPVAGPFDFAFCCFNTLQHLADEEELRTTFAGVAERLADDGIFAFDLYQPNLDYLRRQQRDRMAREIVAPDGRTLQIRENTTYHESAGQLEIDWRLIDVADPSITIAATRYRLRQFPADAVERAIAGSGLRMVSRHGDFLGTPLDAGSKKQVVVCAKA
jgi:SAM-dependent methyltransferase